MKPNRLFVPRFWLVPLLVGPLLLACQQDDQLQPTTYTLDQSASTLAWKGYLKDGSGNNGTINVTGELVANETGAITGGAINLPLLSLINLNLPTDALKDQLIHHLQSPDFFDMADYPQIGFTLTSLTPDPSVPGVSQATGELTLLGKTNPVNFPVNVQAVGNKLAVSGQTSIDRTQWGMDYASDEHAADGLYVKPGIDVQFKLIAVKN